MKKSVYDIVTEQVIAMLESGTAPWRKPWNSVSSLAPMNYKSKRTYGGINFFLLSAKFDDPYFLTFRQAQEMGGNVKKGEKASIVIFWLWKFFDEDGKEIKEEDQAVKKLPIPRYYNVFNATQIEGVDFQYPPQSELKQNEKIQRCEEVVNDCDGLKLKHLNQQKAYYAPKLDLVNMPEIRQFSNSESYYSTLFHELGHWTGHSTRLSRFKKGEKPAAFGDEVYSKEELIAEMASAFLCYHCQINLPEILTNQAAYVQHWIQTLKGDSRLVITAASQAEKAAKFILRKSIN